MSGLPHDVHYSYGVYVALEASSDTKHEYLDGQIYAMGGGSPEHSRLAAAIISSLSAQLEHRGCDTYTSDLRVRTPSGLTTYPDVTVICGEEQRDDTELQAVTNPILLVEVLSTSTERFDRGAKFGHYKSIPTFEQYVLASSRARTIEVWTRKGDAWSSVMSVDGDVADLTSIGAKLDVRAIYERARLT
jgi:Uma2 family endonuclease